jgi:Ca2+-binding RTX toxin-like protein
MQIGITTSSQAIPTGVPQRRNILLDHATNTATNLFGNDYIAGGAGDDMLFGQLGNDTIQGDGSIGTVDAPTVFNAVRLADGSVSVTASVESTSDGDDYIEGNGGNDVVFGNLGQDDIIGGSSSLYGLTVTEANLRPDGADLLFGGAGTDLARNDLGDLTAAGHARDADVILGDNGDIYRIVGTNGTSSGQYLSFTYDNYGSQKIVVRAVKFNDYTRGGATSDLGGDDMIRGESGDDQIYGMTGNDVLFGDGQDDDIYGGAGHDRIYGGSGEDGIVGDEGVIYTSRNGQTERLFGLTTANQQTTLSLPGPFTGSVEFITGRLFKTVNLQARDKGGNDIIYGGLGDDFIHGGAGDDAISGAEALPEFFTTQLQSGANLNPLNYDPTTRKLAAYDANNPLRKINNFLLNFAATDSSGNKIEDGKDRIFGDLGNDWLVGGTGNDRLFGGLGDDLMNADDNLETNGGLNNTPDAPAFADADFVFGGNGLDVMIANTGGDRMFDWNGEFNSYIVPFSSFGNPTVVRSPSPQIRQFLLDLGRASGADQSLSEPNGELGLGDGDNGSPRDPQPGNTNAGRDTQGAPENDSGKQPTASGSTPGRS